MGFEMFILGLINGAMLMGAVWAFMSRGKTECEEELARLRELWEEMHQKQVPDPGGSEKRTSACKYRKAAADEKRGDEGE